MTDVEWPRMTSLDYHSDCCDCESCVEEWAALKAAQRLDTLASNLAIGAALCEAFNLGLYNVEAANVHPSVSWSPGKHRPAP